MHMLIQSAHMSHGPGWGPLPASQARANLRYNMHLGSIFNFVYTYMGICAVMHLPHRFVCR